MIYFINQSRADVIDTPLNSFERSCGIFYDEFSLDVLQMVVVIDTLMRGFHASKCGNKGFFWENSFDIFALSMVK